MLWCNPIEMELELYKNIEVSDYGTTTLWR